VSRLLFRAARLLDPTAAAERVGDLLVVDGRVAAVASRLPAESAGEVIDADGLCLAPGLIDLRVHLREPGHEATETLDQLAAAAAAGGVTRLCGLPGTAPRVEEPSLVLHLVRRAEQVGLVRIGIWGGLTREGRGAQLCEIGLMAEAGAIGFTDAPTPVADAGVLRRALTYARAFDRPVMTTPIDAGLAGMAVATEGEFASRMGLPAMPAMAEELAVVRDLMLARLTGARLHLGPLTTAAAVAAVRRAKAEGLDVTADTAPAYVALNELAIGDYRADMRLTPPLRGEADRLAVVAGLGDGTIDVLTSDHWPTERDAKRRPFAQAEPGSIGVETLLVLGLGLVQSGALSALDLIRRLTAGPAAVLGEPPPSLAPGATADLVLFDPTRAGRIDVQRLRSVAKNSAFDRRPVEGRVLGTWIAGRRTYNADLGAER
jgi:dihydroorotase